MNKDGSGFTARHDALSERVAFCLLCTFMHLSAVQHLDSHEMHVDRIKLIMLWWQAPLLKYILRPHSQPQPANPRSSSRHAFHKLDV
jgi:hypothetical protein